MSLVTPESALQRPKVRPLAILEDTATIHKIPISRKLDEKKRDIVTRIDTHPGLFNLPANILNKSPVMVRPDSLAENLDFFSILVTTRSGFVQRERWKFVERCPQELAGCCNRIAFGGMKV